MNQSQLGLKVADLRQQKGLTQEQLAERCEVSARTIQRIESGEVDPRAYTPHCLGEALDFDFGEKDTSTENLWPPVLHLSSVLCIVIMLLNDGVAENGQCVVSVENLSYLWQPQIAWNSQISHGVGWYVEKYHGLTVIYHEGGSAGCASELVVIPKLNIGFALLTNQMDQVKPVGRMATYRLLEMLTGSKQVYDQQIRESAREIDQQLLTLSLVTQKTVDPDKIAPVLSSFHNDEPGDVKLILHDDHTLWIDFGEYQSPIRPLTTEENQFIFFESAFTGKTLQLKITIDGSPSMRWSSNEGTCNFVATNVQE